MFRKLAMITLLAAAASCVLQDPNQTKFAPTPANEQPGAPLEVAPPLDSAEEAKEHSMEGGAKAETDEQAAPAPSAGVDGPETSKAKPTKSQSARPAAITGCSSETCINHCKSFGAAKQAECATAFAAGCFEPTRDPLQCGNYGIAEDKPKSGEALREMPNPKLY